MSQSEIKTRSTKQKPLSGLIPRALEYDSTPKTPVSGKNLPQNNKKPESSNNEKFLAGYSSFLPNNSRKYESENTDPSDIKQKSVQSHENNNHSIDNKSPLAATPKRVHKMNIEISDPLIKETFQTSKANESPFSAFVKGLSPIHVNLSSPNLMIFKQYGRAHRYYYSFYS